MRNIPKTYTSPNNDSLHEIKAFMIDNKLIALCFFPPKLIIVKMSANKIYRKITI